MELKDYKNDDFQATVNSRLRGIELRFSQKINENVLAKIKDAGFKWSKRQRMWYAYQNEKSVACASSLIDYFENTAHKKEFSPKTEKEPAKIKAEQNAQNAGVDAFRLKPLKILSVEQIENSVKEITVNELADLIRQRAELDRRIAQLEEKINKESKNNERLDETAETPQENSYVFENENGVSENGRKIFLENSERINDAAIKESGTENKTSLKIKNLDAGAETDVWALNEPDAISQEIRKEGAEEVSQEKAESEQRRSESVFDRVTRRSHEEHKEFFDLYEVLKEKYLENQARYIGDQRAEETFKNAHRELASLQKSELDEIIKESETLDEAKENAVKYFNAFGNDGFGFGDNLFLRCGIGDDGPKGEEIQKYIADAFNKSKEDERNEREKIELTEEDLSRIQTTGIRGDLSASSDDNSVSGGYVRQSDERQDGAGSAGLLRSGVQERGLGDKLSELNGGNESAGYGDGLLNHNQITSKAQMRLIREQCKEILKKSDFDISENEKKILALYEGGGGLKEDNATSNETLNAFYTPRNIIKSVWELADFYAPNAVSVLEPASGIGRFAENRPNNIFTLRESDETSSRIAKIIHPDATVIQGFFQSQFFDENGIFRLKNYQTPKYDIVIGNPPYGAYTGEWKGKGEGKEHNRYEEYFIEKGLDSLKDENSILAFVVPSGFLRSGANNIKNAIGNKGKLIDAYRLPNKVFPTTDVGTDIIIMRSWERERREIAKKYDEAYRKDVLNAIIEDSIQMLYADCWFENHPEKILGEVKARTNRFGKEEEYVAVREGLSVQDELDKIGGLLATGGARKNQELRQDEIGRYEQENLNWLANVHGCGREETAEVIHRLYEKFPRWEAFERSKILPIAFGDESYEKRFLRQAAEKEADGRLGLDGAGGKLVGVQWKVTAEDLEAVFGIFDETLDYHTIWDRGWAARNGMSREDAARLLEWDYSDGRNHKFSGGSLEQAAEQKAESMNGENQKADGIKPQAAKIPEGEDSRGNSARHEKSERSAAKSRGEVMSAEEFCRLYGKDFDARELPIWRATDWKGNIDRAKLSFDEENLLHTSKNYVELEPGVFTHKVLFEAGDIFAKIENYKNKISFLNKKEDESRIALYEKNISSLEKVVPPKIPLERIHFGVNSTLAEEFKIECLNADGETEKLNLQESFILWAKGKTWAQATDENYYYRAGIDFSTANISQEDFPQNVSWHDVVEYIDRKAVKAERVSAWRKTDEEITADKAQKRKEAEEKRMARSETADRLFDKYLHEGLSPELSSKIENEYNRRFNSHIIPDYSKLPLFIDGMSREKDGDKFKLYDQQIKGISFLCNKGNGLLAYDVGVGKTAAGIAATVNQIQTGRSVRPLIVVPNAVYAKWRKDISDLFPNIKINDLYNLNKESVSKYKNSENPHKLNIPKNSISLVTYEALKNITFRDESCENELLDDFSKLLSEDFDGNDRDNANAMEKIKGVIGATSQVKNTGYVFFEDCEFDNITVDEAHNFKNLWTVPRPKNKGESNEFSGIPTSKPSARALKLFAMTQLTQRHNDDRNVFLLTATPFTNSPLEVYSMLSYVGRKRLIDSGIYSLRDFCTEFAQTKLELAVNAKGEIDQKQVMKNWKALPALQKILTEFIDKVDGEELKEIIRPKKFTHVQEIEMSDLQKQMMQIDAEKMSEIKEGNSAAVIVSMNAMRLGLVAPTLADPARYPGLEIPSMEKLVETSPKLKFVCDCVIDMYKNNPEKGQFIYMPLGQTAHGIVKDYLVSNGLPKETIEIINGSINNSTEKKEAITERFNDPKNKCKILIGGKNTSEGIDLNGNSFVMYNCSLGWNPSETIQAEGRIWRQGNSQGHVHCVYPVMNDSIDSLLYQKHDEKRSRINEIWTYKAKDTLNVEDINPEELKFELIKDPQKRAKFILENGIDASDYKFTGTKHIQNELNKVNSRIKSFEETEEKRKDLIEELKDTKICIGNRLDNIEDYKSRGLEIPQWCKTELKTDQNRKESYEHQLETINRKYASWGIKDEKDAQDFIPKMNSKKHILEKQLEEMKNELPKILEKETLKMQEKKILLPSISEQRKTLTEDIQKNLRPMTEIEPEIRTLRFEQMLSQKWEKGEITKDEKDLYSSVGYKRYYEWLDGEVGNLEIVADENNEEKKIQAIVETKIKQNTASSTIAEKNEAQNPSETFLNAELFSDQTLEELKQANSKFIPGEQKNHQLFTYSKDGGADEKNEYATLSEAQKEGKKFLSDWKLDKSDNGFVVYNKETKQIESTFGYFPAEHIFGKEVLLNNGYKFYAEKDAFKETTVSEISKEVKFRLEKQNTAIKNVEENISFTQLSRSKMRGEALER